MPQCPKCHHHKKKSVYAKHVKVCNPVRSDLEHFIKSKSGKHDSNCNCKKCQKRKKRKAKLKK